jgi:hypothetical protein
LLAYSQGQAPTEIQRALGVSRPTIYKCIDQALATGVATGLRDRYHRVRAPEISDDAKAWVVDVACRKPKDLGFAAELWTLSALAEYVAAQAAQAGLPRLSRAGKTTVWCILDAHELKPHRVRYYIEHHTRSRAHEGSGADGLSRRLSVPRRGSTRASGTTTPGTSPASASLRSSASALCFMTWRCSVPRNSMEALRAKSGLRAAQG